MKEMKKFLGNDNGIKVMVVEDYATLREVISKKLVKENFVVFPAADGMEALEGIEKTTPDIVLLDIVMPGINGFEVLKKIKSNSNSKIAKVPVIMLSNLGDQDDINKAMALGATGYMVKSNFTVDEVIERIKKVLGK